MIELDSVSQVEEKDVDEWYESLSEDDQYQLLDNFLDTPDIFSDIHFDLPKQTTPWWDMLDSSERSYLPNDVSNFNEQINS